MCITGSLMIPEFDPHGYNSHDTQIFESISVAKQLECIGPNENGILVYAVLFAKAIYACMHCG